MGAAHTLAVDGRHLAVGQGKGVLHPVPKALLEPGRMQPRKVPPQRVVRGDPARQCQEGAQPLLVELAEERDDRQHRQHQDVRQVVSFGAVAPRIFQGLDQGRRHRAVREGCFAGLDPEPSNIGRCPSAPCRPPLDAIALAYQGNRKVAFRPESRGDRAPRDIHERCLGTEQINP